jgi:hypothetical protein
MNRVIRDGRVAVLSSPGFGAGWYTSHYYEALVFDPSIVQWLENNERDKIKNYMTLKYPDVYLGGLDNLKITWVSSGSIFRIEEYDGSESIIIKEQDNWLTA